MGRLRKADCTTEEWAEELRKAREQHARRAANPGGVKRRWRKADFTPEEWERVRETARRSEAAKRARKMSTEAGCQREAERSRARYARTMADPVTRELYLERQRVKDRRRRHLAKLFTPGKPLQVESGDALSSMRAKAMSVPAFDQIIRAMPAKWSMDFKEEIAAEAIILLLDRTAATVTEAVKLGLKVHGKLYDRFRTVSIDAENSDGFRIIDTIPSDYMEDYL